MPKRRELTIEETESNSYEVSLTSNLRYQAGRFQPGGEECNAFKSL